MKPPQILTTLGHLGHKVENKAQVNCISYTAFFIGSKPLQKAGDDPYLTDGNRRNRSKIKKFPEVRAPATAWDRKL